MHNILIATQRVLGYIGDIGGRPTYITPCPLLLEITERGEKSELLEEVLQPNNFSGLNKLFPRSKRDVVDVTGVIYNVNASLAPDSEIGLWKVRTYRKGRGVINECYYDIYPCIHSYTETPDPQTVINEYLKLNDYIDSICEEILPNDPHIPLSPFPAMLLNHYERGLEIYESSNLVLLNTPFITQTINYARQRSPLWVEHGTKFHGGYFRYAGLWFGILGKPLPEGNVFNIKIFYENQLWKLLKTMESATQNSQLNDA